MLFKAIVIFIVSIYSISITSGTAFARGRKRKSNKRQSNSKRKGRNKRSQSSAKYTEKTENKNNNTTNTEIQENKQETSVANTNNQIQQNTNLTNDSTKQESKVETQPQQEEVKSDPNDKTTPDVSKDPKWEEFRLCMQQGCAGGDDQPNNVECYKSVNFDNQFNSCKPLIAENKRTDFKKYFLNTFIPNEKKEFCENKEGTLQGIYENDTCKITIKFKRNGHKNECLSSCDKITQTKTISINKSFTCSPDFFGVSTCYKDSPNCQTAKMKKITGGIAIAGGAISGLASGLTTALSAISTKVKIKDEEQSEKKDGEKTTTVEINSIKELEKYKNRMTTTEYQNAENSIKKNKKNKAIDATLGALSAGMEGVSKGTGELVAASFLEKEKGEPLRGNCIFPDGSAIGEGMSKKITW